MKEAGEDRLNARIVIAANIRRLALDLLGEGNQITQTETQINGVLTTELSSGVVEEVSRAGSMAGNTARLPLPHLDAGGR